MYIYIILTILTPECVLVYIVKSFICFLFSHFCVFQWIFGFASVLGSNWLQGPFPEEWQKKSIAVREMVSVLLAMVVWYKVLAISNVLLYVDNISVVHVINKQTSPDVFLLQMIRKICCHISAKQYCYSSKTYTW